MQPFATDFFAAGAARNLLRLPVQSEVGRLRSRVRVCATDISHVEALLVNLFSWPENQMALLLHPLRRGEGVDAVY